MGSPDRGNPFDAVSPGAGTPDTPLGRAKEWLLIDGHRGVIAAALAAATFLLLLALQRADVIAFLNDDSVTRLAGGMIAGTLSLVTLVVSINQLILSREFKAAGEIREQLGETVTFRSDVADATGVPATPAEPTGMLALLVEDISRQAEALDDQIDSHPDAEVREQTRQFVDHVKRHSTSISETLGGAEFGTTTALSAAISYDDSWQLYAARHLRSRAGDREGMQASFDDLIDALTRFTVAREHLKTTYLQRELTQFSQLTILFGVPAVGAAIMIGLVYSFPGGAVIEPERLTILTSALITIVLLPLMLLASFIMQTATIARRTAAIGPILPEKDPDTGPFDVEYDSEAG